MYIEFTFGPLLFKLIQMHPCQVKISNFIPQLSEYFSFISYFMLLTLHWGLHCGMKASTAPFRDALTWEFVYFQAQKWN